METQFMAISHTYTDTNFAYRYAKDVTYEWLLSTNHQ